MNIHGKGTFVAPNRITRNLLEMNAPLQDTYKLLGIQKIRAEGSVSRRLNLSPRSDVWQIRRIRLSSGQRISIETSYIPLHFLKSVDLQQLEEKSMCTFYNRGTESALTTSDIHISIGVAGFEESAWLNVPEHSYVTVEKHLVYCEQIPVEYFISVSSAEKVKYSVTLQTEPIKNNCDFSDV